MRCPNKKCNQQVTRIRCMALPNGKAVWGCESCLQERVQKKVYSGRKLWLGSEVDGPKKNEQIINDWADRTMANAANIRRRYPIRDVVE